MKIKLSNRLNVSKTAKQNVIQNITIIIKTNRKKFTGS